MQKYDAQTLAQNLNALAEVFDRKPVSVKALEVWFDSLKEFPTERVMGLLISWPKSHGKFPAPSEVWKACNESLIDEREEKSLRERRENVIPLRWPKTPHAAACLREMALIFKRPKGTPREHWQRLLEDAPAGSLARRTAEEVLKKRQPIREPGQDDEERAA
jgi:hypothetical protein